VPLTRWQFSTRLGASRTVASMLSRAHKAMQARVPSWVTDYLERSLLQFPHLLNNEVLLKISHRDSSKFANSERAKVLLETRRLSVVHRLRLESDRHTDTSVIDGGKVPDRESREATRRVSPVSNHSNIHPTAEAPTPTLQVIVPLVAEPWWLLDRLAYFEDLCSEPGVSLAVASALSDDRAVTALSDWAQRHGKISFIHKPGSSLQARLALSLDYPSADYVLFHPHDEVFSRQGLRAALKVASVHRGDAVNGQTYCLRGGTGHLVFGEMYKYQANMKGGLPENFSSALSSHFSPYKQKYFNSICPSKFYNDCVTLWSDWHDDVILGEIIFEAVGFSTLTYRRIDAPIRLRNTFAKSEWDRSRWIMASRMVDPIYAKRTSKPFSAWLIANGLTKGEGRAADFISHLSSHIAKELSTTSEEIELALRDAFVAYGRLSDTQNVEWRPIEDSSKIFQHHPQIQHAVDRYARLLGVRT